MGEQGGCAVRVGKHAEEPMSPWKGYLERVKKCILRSAEWGRWSESTSPSLGGKRPAADLVFDDRLPPYLFRSSPFMSSFSSLSLFPQAVARAASVRVGRRRKANHLVRL